MSSENISSLQAHKAAKDDYEQALRALEPLAHRFPWVNEALANAKKISNPESRMKYLARALRDWAQNSVMQARWVDGTLPIGPREFVESPEYLNQKGILFPAVMDEFCAMNSGDYIEAVLTGGIGVGKSTLAIFTAAYQVYLLSKLVEPQREYGISPTDEIMFVFQSVTKDLAKTVDFARFRELIAQSPYFTNKFAPDTSKTESLTFPKRIIVKALSGSTTAALGQNVFGGILDEVNFMAIVEKSKMTRDSSQHDQAWENYNTIVRRRQSRFMKQGRLPGMFCLVSSRNYPGEFTDVKEAEARKEKEEKGFTTTYIYDKRVWEIKPKDTFTGKWFKVFVGDMTRKPRFLKDEETVPPIDSHLVMEIPAEFKKDFEQDIIKALRDIAGIATGALHPFILDKDAISACFGLCPSILTSPMTDFADHPVGIKTKLLRQLHRPRFIHMDLALTGDSAGVACGFVDNFKKIERGDHTEIMPIITFDFVLQVKPPKNGEILFYKIRELVYKLANNGLPIRWVSLDTFQSFDMIQQLRQNGYQSEVRSVDTETAPYDVAKQAIMDGRVISPEHDLALQEFARLELDTKKKKIDHPPNFSKDCSDAMASVIFGLTVMAETWVGNGISLDMVPVWLKTLEENTRNNRSNAGRVGEN